MNKPPGYEKKFASFIRKCSKAKAQGAPEVMVSSPSELGNTYDELIENLSRLADAGLSLRIATQRGSDVHRSEETGSD